MIVALHQTDSAFFTRYIRVSAVSPGYTEYVPGLMPKLIAS